MKKLLPLLLFTSPLFAQELFPGYLQPGFRGTTNSEYSEWDIFSSPYADPNFGDVAAAPSNPTITQTGTDSAFLTGGFNIYSFAAATAFEVANTLTAPVNNVVFQFDTLGTFIDYSTIQLNYATAGGQAATLGATNFISESRVITGGMGGFDNRAAMQWNLTGLNISSYTITFAAAGSSCSFNSAVLDTSSGAFTEIVPSARTWDGGAGSSKWSLAANWSNDQQTSQGGNILFDTSAPSTVELDLDRKVGQLTINKTSTFELSGSSLLTLDTGITLIAGGNAKISTAVFLGAHGFLDVGANGSLELSGPVSGIGVTGSYPAAGIYKTGTGTAILSGNNTFTGGVTLDGGQLIIAGSNIYTGSTGINQGQLILRGDALNNTAGALGISSGNIAVGVDPATFGALAEAGLLIDGNHTVGRNLAISSGNNVKVVGAENTTAALYSGSVVLASTADKVVLRSVNFSDVVTFSGAISGGSTSLGLTKDGSGTVIYSGANKTYSNATTVSAGALQIQSGTSATGNGAWTVSSGATLRVNGALGGTGALTLNGGMLTGSGTINKSLLLDTGDVISPGNSPGQINTGAQTWAAGGSYLWELSDVAAGAGLGWDLDNIAGSLSLTATNVGKFTLTLSTLGLVPSGFDSQSNYSWIIASATSISGFNAAQFNINTSGFVGANGIFSVIQSGNNLSLAYTAAAVPEPSTWALLLTGAGLLVWKFRRRSPSQSF